MKQYSRDKRSPIPKSTSVSKIMSANKAKNSSPELMFRKYLWNNGLRGYRLHYSKVPGRPDIAFVSKKIAIFINGCYWHRCPICKLPLPKNNQKFWQEKFDKNIARDKRKIQLLEFSEWQAVVLWECELKKDLAACVNKLKPIMAQ